MSDRIGAVRAALEGVDINTPAGAFVFGMAYGQALERERVDAEDLAVAGAAARDVARVIAWAAARP